MAGGHPGQKGENHVYKFNEEGELEVMNLGGKAIVHLKSGEYVQINTPGGGGYGRSKGDKIEEEGYDDFHRAYV